MLCGVMRCGAVWCGAVVLPFHGGGRISMHVFVGMMQGPGAPSPTCWDCSAQHHEGVWSSRSSRSEGRSAPSATNSKSLWRALCRSSTRSRR